MFIKKKLQRLSILKAVKEGNLERVEKLLDEYVDVDTKDNKNRTLLNIAAECGHTNIVGLLLKRRANANSACYLGFTALHVACHKDNRDIVEVLLDHGVDPTIKNKFGRTALHLSLNERSITSLLLQKDTTIINQTDNEGNTALHSVCFFDGSPQVVQVLLENRIDVHAKNNEGKTAIEYAKSERIKDILEKHETCGSPTTGANGVSDPARSVSSSESDHDNGLNNMHAEMLVTPPRSQSVPRVSTVDSASTTRSVRDETLIESSGLSLLEDIQTISSFLESGDEENAKKQVQTCRGKSYPAPNIFELIPPEDILELLKSSDQKFYEAVKEAAQSLIDMVDTNIDKPDEVVFGNSQNKGPLATKKPLVMDHTIREPATNTPYGHTAHMKYLTWKLVKSIGCKSVALSGLYYGDSYSVEEQFLELLFEKEGKDGMKGGFVMCGPGKADREKAMKMIEKTEVPNLFLDVTTLPSVRFDSKSIPEVGTDIVEAVEAAEKILPAVEDGEDCEPMGQIYVNFVDLMECVDLDLKGCASPLEKHEPEHYMANTENREALEEMFNKIKTKKRIKAILYEEGRGRGLHSDYAVIAKWLRKHFPLPYKILVHAHGGSGTEHAASLESVNAGADGVWAGFIPQAARAGHNSYFLYLDNLLLNGNKHVWEKFDLHVGVEIAKMLYSLNFNSVTYPNDCPIWGNHAQPQVHTAFNITNFNDWRIRTEGQYHNWSGKHKSALDRMRKKLQELELEILQDRIPRRLKETDRKYRIAPLVTDATNIGKSMGELELVKKGKRRAKEAVKETGEIARKIMLATMNAGIRVDYDDPRMLEKLAEWIQWIATTKGRQSSDTQINITAPRLHESQTKFEF